MKRKAYLAIQCTAPGTEETGDFLFFGAASHKSPDAKLASPVFAHLGALYIWLKENGWTEAAFDRDHPVGVYEKEMQPVATGEAA